MLTAADRRRLIGALNLLNSSLDGEVLGAAHGALRVLRAAGVSWDMIIAPAGPQPSREPHDDDAHDGDWRELAATLLRRCGGAFNDFERAFLRDIGGFTHPSEKQRALLARLAERARQGARAA